MARRTIYVRGVVPAPEPVEQLAGHSSFLKDARAVLEVDTESFERLLAALGQCESFVTDDQLKSIVKGCVGEDRLADAAFDLVRHLNRTLRDLGDPIEKTLARLRSAIREHAEDIPVEDRETLGERLEKLVLAPSGLGLQWKAEQLAGSTGIEVEDIQLVCDIRPVFDEARSTIMGAVPVSTLKFSVLGPDGTPENIELRLTEAQVADLGSKAELAQQKIGIIKKTLNDKRIPWVGMRATDTGKGTA